MPKTGTPFGVRMTNCGPLGWVSDEAGYRYQPTHPHSGEPWPPMPAMLLAAWQDLAGYPHPPEWVDRIIPGSSTLLPDGSRINLTLRPVNGPP